MDSSSGYIPVSQQPPPYASPDMPPALKTTAPYRDQQPNSHHIPSTAAASQHTVVVVTQPDPCHHGAIGGVPLVIGMRCPNCIIGVVRENFTLLGLLWAIFCFPCGLICLFTLRDRRCTHCGYSLAR